MYSNTNTAKRFEAVSAEGRLIGWLVSYGLDNQGAAYELREGRCFLGSQPLNDQKVITINEGTISAPHLALSASPRHRVMVQDIFSEHGSFITKARSGRETAISGPTEIEHGDWLRIGESTRFQVCLIDGPGK